MNFTVEEWIEQSHRKFKAMMDMTEDETITIDGRAINITSTPEFREACFTDACKYIKEEIYFRKMYILEKHCEN